MTEYIEKKGKTTEEAIQAALTELGAQREDVEIIVVDEGSKGLFFGIGAKDAVIKAKKIYNPQKAAESFLKEVCSNMGLDIETDIRIDGKFMNIEIKGEGMGMLIGKRGRTLDSLQYLTSLVVNKGDAPFINIALDTENYRQRRKETLETLAYNLAKKARVTGKKVMLEPMTPYERSIIHSALQNDKYVITHSQGEEPYRKVIIYLRNLK